MAKIKEYIFASSTQELLPLLQDDKTAIIAGGTHVNVTKGGSYERLIDITRLGLNFIRLEGRDVRIGSTTTISSMLESPIVQMVGNGILSKACSLIGDTPLRNVITLGGNIAKRIPWAGLPVALLVIDAKIEIINRKNVTYSLPALDFFNRGGIKKGEFLKQVILPIHENRFYRYERFALTATDYSWLTLGFSTDYRNGIIEDSRIAISRIIQVNRIIEVEKELNGIFITNLNINQIISKLKDQIRIVADYRSSKEYREYLLSILFKRMLSELEEEATE